MQRVRLRFCRGEQLKYVGHLDLFRLWERALRRARLPLAYSQGHTAHPRIALAAPLPVGVTSECELMDVVLTRALPMPSVVQALNLALPQGMRAFDAWEVPLSLPALQATVRAAEYQVVASGPGPQDAIAAFLAAGQVPWEERRAGRVRQYDLRRLVEELRLEGQQDGDWVLAMRLRHDESGAGRAEQVTAALGFAEPPISVHRRQLILAPLEPKQGHDGTV